MKPTVISAEALFEEFRTTLHWEWIAGHAHPERHFDEAATQRHLEILSEIAEMLSDRELRERLKTEPLAAEVHRIIAAWEPLKSVA